MDEKDFQLLTFKHIPVPIEDNVIHVHVMHLSKSAMVWINSSVVSMNNLSVAMPTKFSDNTTSLNLLGSRSDSTSSNIAQRLSKRSKKQVFVSSNIPEPNLTMLSKIESLLVEELLQS